MATTSTNKQPLLIDRVFHNVVESNTLTSGSETALDILGTNQSAVLVDCTGNDGGLVEDIYAIARTTSSTTYKVLFYLSSSVDYLRPGEGVYIGSLETSDTSDTKSQYTLPKVLAPVAQVGDGPSVRYIPVTCIVGVMGSTNSSDTPPSVHSGVLRLL